MANISKEIEPDLNDAEVNMSPNSFSSDSLPFNQFCDSNQGRTKVPPLWMRDYEIGERLFDEKTNMVMFANIDSNPIHFEDTIKKMKNGDRLWM